MSIPFAKWLTENGIIPPQFFHHDRWQRVSSTSHPRKKNVAIKLAGDERSGWAKDHANGQDALRWRLEGDSDRREERSSEDNARLSAKLAEQRARETQAIIKARALYAKSEPLKYANHEYLRRKKLDMMGCRGIRVDAEGWLVVPMYRDGKILSVQRISPEGDKRFFTGAPTKGAHFQIWRPKPSMTVLCEGLATGLAIFSALPQAVVEVCFSASNMVAVAEREDWRGMVAVAADNDHWTQERDGKNPGIEAAERAAKVIGCGYAVPRCEGTDWHDFMTERLSILEKADEEKTFRAHPAKLRQNALMPIRVEIMRAARFVSSTTP